MSTERDPLVKHAHLDATGEFTTADVNEKGGKTEKAASPSFEPARPTVRDETGMHMPVGMAPPPLEATIDATIEEIPEMFEPRVAGAAPIQKPEKATAGATLLDATGEYVESATGAYETDAAKAASDRCVLPQKPPTGTVRCGRYILKKFHARGGMGEIWMAEDSAIGRSVALKRMLGRRAARSATTGSVSKPRSRANWSIRASCRSTNWG